MNNTFEFHGSYICHYRTKGSKNGVRLYQNEDGSVTPAGAERYYVNGKAGMGMHDGDGDGMSRKQHKISERINKSYDRYNKKLSRIKAKADKHGNSLKSNIVSNLMKDNEDNRAKALDMTKNANKQYFKVNKRLWRDDMDVNSMATRRLRKGEKSYQKTLAKTISKFSNKKLSELHSTKGSTEHKLTTYIQRVSEHGGYSNLRRGKTTGLKGYGGGHAMLVATSSRGSSRARSMATSMAVTRMQVNSAINATRNGQRREHNFGNGYGVYDPTSEAYRRKTQKSIY